MDQFSSESIVADMNLGGEPPAQLKVNNGGEELTPGLILTPRKVKDLPTMTFDGQDGVFYTLAMNDPDAPSRKDPKVREWHHWLVVNIPGNDVSKGDVKSDYIGAGPPQGTAKVRGRDTGVDGMIVLRSEENLRLHRYVLLVYKQPGKIDFTDLPKLTRRTDDRASHKMSQFVTKWGLQELVAGNFFQAKYDDYVPELHEELGIGKK